jgi:outer membrane protein
MVKKETPTMNTKFAATLTLACLALNAHAADLVEVYQQALSSDPTYQQAISQELSTKEGVPISLASLLPNVAASFNPSVTRTAYSGVNVAFFNTPRNNTAKNYDLVLSLNQTVFNYAQFANLSSAFSNSKGAEATLNAALQSLMTRVATAYFNVLKDEDNLSYSEASKMAYAEQLDQVKQQYDVGLKTITDVYTAQASYDSALANFIASQTTLNNDRENLRVITGTYYNQLASLKEDFPLVTPKPNDIEAWVKTAQQQNWQVRSAAYTVDANRATIHQQFGSNLPTATLQGTLDRQYDMNINGYRNLDQRNGPSTQTDRSVMLTFNMPIVEGGGTVAQTKQAVYNYEASQQQFELTLRNTINTTRQSYLGIIAGISQIDADRQAIKSSISSLQGMEESYKVGTETLVDVLNQQQKVFQAQTQYATDRYAFVNNVLALKQAAGTLSFDDLRAINAWLYDKTPTDVAAVERNLFKHNHIQLKPKKINSKKKQPTRALAHQTKSTTIHKKKQKV